MHLDSMEVRAAVDGAVHAVKCLVFGHGWPDARRGWSGRWRGDTLSLVYAASISLADTVVKVDRKYGKHGQ